MPTAPSAAIETLPRDFGDWFNPMLVKELRQGLRTRVFTLLLMVGHLFFAALLGSALMGAQMEDVNAIFWWGSWGLLLLFMPLRAFSSLHAEQRNGTLEMLRMTGIGSFRLIYGKWAALFSQTLLLASTLLPYMIARYQFGGVEIAQELLALVLTLLLSAVFTAGILACSSQRSLVLRIMLFLSLALLLLPLGFMVFLIRDPDEGSETMSKLAAMEPWALAAMAIYILVLSAYVAYMFLAMGASRIAPPSENHSTVKRLAALAVSLLLVVVTLVMDLNGFDRFLAWTWMPLIVLTLLSGMDVLTEDMPRYPTVVAALARRGERGRLLGRFLHPGWASGVICYAVMTALAMTGIAIAVANVSRSSDINSMLAVAFTFLAITIVPVCVRLNKVNRFANWWAVQWMFIGVNVLLLTMASAGLRSVGAIGILTPVTSFVAYFSVSFGSGSVEGLMVTGGMISLVWFLGALVIANQEMGVYAALEAQARELEKK